MNFLSSHSLQAPKSLEILGKNPGNSSPAMAEARSLLLSLHDWMQPAWLRIPSPLQHVTAALKGQLT